MYNRFKSHIDTNFPELKKNKFLLACSGGVDSVVLAHLCHASNLNFAIAHCNFKLRAQESDEDQSFVQNLADDLKVDCFITQFDTKKYAEEHKTSIQIAARELRYTWFAEIQKINNIPILVTAHHADDDLETFIINLSRGTGINGLTGIPKQNTSLARPLLNFSREQILAFANAQKINWREDASNNDTKYLRNKVRHKIVPLLKELHPTFLQNFLKTQEFLNQTAYVTEAHIESLKEQIFVSNDDVIRIDIKKIKELTPIKYYVHALFNDYNFKEWDNVIDLLTAMSGKEIYSKTHKLVKNRDYLLLSKIESEENSSYKVQKNCTFLKEPIQITIREVKALEQVTSDTLYVDKKTLKYPLVVRKWEEGDYFYPLGMKGKKKVAKFFKDEKIDIISKQKQWLLCSDNKIVWVIGKRADDRFKITDATKSILKFEVIK